MTQAKRALPARRRRGVWILIVVPLVLLVAATFILFGLQAPSGGGYAADPAGVGAVDVSGCD